MKLVPNWTQAWKWFSMQSMTLSAALLGGWQALSPDLKSMIPSEYVMGVSAGVLVFGVIGRLVDQSK